MAVGLRIDIEFFEENGEGRATVGDIRRWLALADKNGVTDEEELFMVMDSKEEINGFYVYGNLD
ncbi:hypothetical protein [Glutamicibacter sp. M10]|uniref:hypothetical protein n=1 Tax=Glutamicibacter sp. M10 TaxID=3023076 RepID=UPI0021C96D08|nr:hypothetical protein [Glutamicibacter sp. M10]UXN30984.1 hypothetical protein N6V40_11180 [Glutamicibacter sp. M10]